MELVPMKNYYVLKRSGLPADFFVEKFDYSPADLLRHYLRGDSFSKLSPQILVYYDSRKGHLTDLLGTATFLIANNRAKGAFNKFAKHVEEFPISIVERGKSIDADYSLINIIDWGDAMDHSLSKYEYYPGSEVIMRLDILVLDPAKINGRDIFRIPEFGERVFVSEDFKTEIENQKLTGFAFLPVDEFTEGVW